MDTVLITKLCQGTDDIFSSPELWLQDSNGHQVINKNAPLLDFRKPEAREAWTKGNNGQWTVNDNLIITSNVSVPANVISSTNGGANGVFVDGTHYVQLTNCHYKSCGDTGTECCHFSHQQEDDYNLVSSTT